MARREEDVQKVQEVQEVQSAPEGQTITTRAPKAEASEKKPAGWSISLPDPFLGDLDSLSEKYGAEVIAESARAQLRIKFQAAVRSLAESGKPDEEISATMATWKPGDKLGLGGDPQAVILKNFGNMSPEQRAQLIAQLSAM